MDNTLSNAGLTMLQSLVQLYTYCYNELNLPLPPPDRVYVISRTATSAWDHVPPAVRQYYGKFIQVPGQSNVISLLLLLFVLYIFLNLLMATVRSFVRVLFEFIPFCLMVTIIAICAMLIQQYYFPDLTRQHDM